LTWNAGSSHAAFFRADRADWTSSTHAAEQRVGIMARFCGSLLYIHKVLMLSLMLLS
jgi:hypothetical protein